jgi:hypothetical protein
MAENDLLGVIGLLEEERTRLQGLINSLRMQHRRSSSAALSSTSLIISTSVPRLPDHDDVDSPLKTEAELPTSHPFTSPEADIVLRSSDGVEYRLFKRILSEGSPFFSTMFTLPEGAVKEIGPPFLDLSEESRILTPLFQLLYPMHNPPIPSLDEVNELIGTAIKYDMQGPLQTLREWLVSAKYTTSDAFRLFSIAVRHQLTEEIPAILKKTFKLCLLDMPVSDDHRFITGYEFFKLIKIHQKRCREAQEVIRSARPSFKCPGCSKKTTTLASTWWNDFEQRACEELQRRPSTKIIFCPAFIAKSAKILNDPNVPAASRCNECAIEMINSHGILESLRNKIENLPVDPL